MTGGDQEDETGDRQSDRDGANHGLVGDGRPYPTLGLDLIGHLGLILRRLRGGVLLAWPSDPLGQSCASPRVLRPDTAANIESRSEVQGHVTM